MHSALKIALLLSRRNLVVNGNFDSDTAGWTLSQTVTASVPSWDAGVLKMNSDGSGFSRADQSIPTIAGRTYTIKGVVGGSAQTIRVGVSQGGTTLLSVETVPVGEFSYTFTAAGETSWIRLEDGGVPASYFDSISVR